MLIYCIKKKIKDIIENNKELQIKKEKRWQVEIELMKKLKNRYNEKLNEQQMRLQEQHNLNQETLKKMNFK